MRPPRFALFGGGGDPDLRIDLSILTSGLKNARLKAKPEHKTQAPPMASNRGDGLLLLKPRVPHLSDALLAVAEKMRFERVAAIRSNMPRDLSGGLGAASVIFFLIVGCGVD